MKPNEFNNLKIQIGITLLIMTLIGYTVKANVIDNSSCGANLNLISQNSEDSVYVHKNLVLANSTEKNDIFSIPLKNKMHSLLYDWNSDKFICINLKNRKVVARRFPQQRSCAFVEKSLPNMYFAYELLSNASIKLSFSKSGGSKPNTRHSRSSFFFHTPPIPNCSISKKFCRKVKRTPYLFKNAGLKIFCERIKHK